MSARTDYPWHAAMEQLNQHSGIASALDEIDALRLTLAWTEDIARCRGEENEVLRDRLRAAALHACDLPDCPAITYRCAESRTP